MTTPCMFFNLVFFLLAQDLSSKLDIEIGPKMKKNKVIGQPKNMYITYLLTGFTTIETVSGPIIFSNAKCEWTSTELRKQSKFGWVWKKIIQLNFYCKTYAVKHAINATFHKISLTSKTLILGIFSCFGFISSNYTTI